MIFTDIAQSVWDAFSGMGDAGMLSALAVLIWIDGTAFPTLPEAWLVAVIEGHTAGGSVTPGFGAAIVLVATAASLAGTMTLYLLIRIGWLPKRVQKAMRSWTHWLVVSDERLLLLNRFAPLIPYTGAFIAVNNWDIKKSVVYMTMSGVAKFAAWVVVFTFLNEQIADSMNHWISLIVVAVVIVSSIAASIIYKRRREAGGEKARQPPSSQSQ